MNGLARSVFVGVRASQSQIATNVAAERRQSLLPLRGLIARKIQSTASGRGYTLPPLRGWLLFN